MFISCAAASTDTLLEFIHTDRTHRIFLMNNNNNILGHNWNFSLDVMKYLNFLYPELVSCNPFFRDTIDSSLTWKFHFAIWILILQMRRTMFKKDTTTQQGERCEEIKLVRFCLKAQSVRVTILG